MVESFRDFKLRKNIHKGMPIQGPLLYLLGHHNWRVCGQKRDKFALDTMGEITTEKSNRIEHNLPNLELLAWGNQDQELKIRIPASR